MGVRYWDVHNFSELPRSWDYGEWHHAVMGVELLTDRGPSCVLWTSTFYSYGVEAFHAPMSEHILTSEDGPESWDACVSGRWQDRLNSPIITARTFWERLTIGPGYKGGVRISDPYDVDVPVALRLDFTAGPVWMVAGMPNWPDVHPVFVCGDEIMVVFEVGLMREIGFPDSEFLADLGA